MMLLFALNIALAGMFAAAAGLIVERLCPRRAVALRHGLLFVSLIVISLAPLLAIIGRTSGIGMLRPWPQMSSVDAVDESSPVAVQKNVFTHHTSAPIEGMVIKSPPLHAEKSWSPVAMLRRIGWIVVIAWAAGTVVQLRRLLRGSAMLRRLSFASEAITVRSEVSLGSSEPGRVAPVVPQARFRTFGPTGPTRPGSEMDASRHKPQIHRLVSSCARRLGLRRTPAVCWSAIAPSPLVAGVLRPCVILPQKAAELSHEELQAVLLHELAHLARGDHWTGLVESLVRAVFWWCPPVLMLLRRLGDLREQLCDAHVVSCQGDGFNLASALLAVCEWSISGRPLYGGAAALGAAGRSGLALQTRIQALVQKEDHPMIHMNLGSRLALGAAGVLIGGVVIVANVGASDSSPGTRAPSAVALSSEMRMLSADDFWAKDGATTKHTFDAPTIEELKKLSETADRPAIRIRAHKLLCDLAEHTRIVSDLSEADAARAVAISFEYLETHLADPAIAKYAPQAGFSHLTIGSKFQGGDPAWLLMETVGNRPGFNGGLNIRYDLKASKVQEVNHWGDIRPAAK